MRVWGVVWFCVWGVTLCIFAGSATDVRLVTAGNGFDSIVHGDNQPHKQISRFQTQLLSPAIIVHNADAAQTTGSQREQQVEYIPRPRISALNAKSAIR